ncbi:hypothetical protein [Devosia aurantiaca]|uniref:Uncharacterized protein n=1 Tax=Devosia aurantiaca TaxID=2714858 RepID=A0A6M1SLQ0_9HYPH|nr:hypothetical protein [Devosia aurantiaca]NGP16462.1 hypothetical protein [Devosia aurantiaca]
MPFGFRRDGGQKNSRAADPPELGVPAVMVLPQGNAKAAVDMLHVQKAPVSELIPVDTGRILGKFPARSSKAVMMFSVNGYADRKVAGKMFPSAWSA